MQLVFRSIILFSILANTAGLTSGAETGPSASTNSAPSTGASENNNDSAAAFSNSAQTSAENILEAFRAEGLPIGASIIYTPESDPNSRLGRPGQYIGKASWADTRIEQPQLADEPIGGTVEVFSSESELAARRDYIKSVQESMPMLQQYIFESGNALLRLEFSLTPDQAAQYEKVLKSLYEK